MVFCLNLQADLVLNEHFPYKIQSIHRIIQYCLIKTTDMGLFIWNKEIVDVGLTLRTGY